MSAPASSTFIDGAGIAEGCKQLEDAGAAVVGLNCGRGPQTMIPLLKEIKQLCKVGNLFWKIFITIHILKYN